MKRVALVAAVWFLFWIIVGAVVGGLTGGKGGGVQNGIYFGAFNGTWWARFTSFAWPWIMQKRIDRWMYERTDGRRLRCTKKAITSSIQRSKRGRDFSIARWPSCLWSAPFWSWRSP